MTNRRTIRAKQNRQSNALADGVFGFADGIADDCIDSDPENDGTNQFHLCVSAVYRRFGWLIAVIDKGNLRKCPFCAELVKPEAVVCRYCGKDLPEVKAEPVRPEPLPKSTTGEWIALAAFVAALVLAGVIATVYFKHEDAVNRDKQAAAASQGSTSTPSERRPPPQIHQIVTLTREVTVGNVVLPPGTQASLIGLSGDKATISYEGSDYEIPASWTDLK